MSWRNELYPPRLWSVSRIFRRNGRAVVVVRRVRKFGWAQAIARAA
jgi:hypothetical protein